MFTGGFSLRHKRYFITLVALMLLIEISPCVADDFTRSEATGSCMLFIKQTLHDPDSAEFSHSGEATILYMKGGRAVVIRGVRAKNGFGAKRYEEVACFMENHGGIVTPILVTKVGDNTKKSAALMKKWGVP